MAIRSDGADLIGADFDGATLTGVTWGNTTCPDGTNKRSPHLLRRQGEGRQHCCGLSSARSQQRRKPSRSLSPWRRTPYSSVT